MSDPLNAVLLHRTPQVPTSEQVAEMLRENGYPAYFKVKKGLSTKAIVRIGPSQVEITKLYYSENSPPLIIDFECDLWGFYPSMLPIMQRATKLKALFSLMQRQTVIVECFTSS